MKYIQTYAAVVVAYLHIIKELTIVLGGGLGPHSDLLVLYLH